jgi:ABC-type dipeptide/oligopeptide/nickel transport system ATPase component
MAMPAREALLEIRDVEVEIVNRKQVAHILRGISLTIEKGEMHGLVGETGSGKSMTARAVINLLPTGGLVNAGSIKLAGRELVGLDEDEMREIRGPQIGMIFQNPRTALHPLLSVESQMSNVISAHRSLSKSARKARIREYLALAGIPEADRVARAYPHELSGGMAQRVVIATVLISEPIFLIADEPTTGLDATVQRQILEEFAGLQARLHLSVMMITHDLAIVAQYCDSISVMHEGLIVEQGPKRQVLLEPEHPYTRRLIEASKLEDIGKEPAAA